MLRVFLISALFLAAGCASSASTGMSLADGVDGVTVMDCIVREDGRLEQCALISETPTGQGFGEQALATAHRFQMRTLTRNGRSIVGARVRLPMRWRIEDDGAATSDTSLDLPPPEA